MFQTTRGKEMGTTLLNSDSGVAPGEQQCGARHWDWLCRAPWLGRHGTGSDGKRHGN